MVSQETDSNAEVRHSAIRPDAVRRKVQAWLAERDGAMAIALAARPEWPVDPRLTVDGVPIRVVPCATPLAARAALHDRAEHERLVLLTELGERELGDGLLAHLSMQTVRKVKPWDLVRQMFGVVDLDPSLVRTGRWVADALSDHAPAGGWPAPPGTILTRDHAMRCLAAELLELPRDELDTPGLLQWSTNAPAQLRFGALPAKVIDGVERYLTETAGSAAIPMMSAVRAGHGVDAIPIGLLAGVLWPEAGTEPPSVTVAVARARLEPRFGGTRITSSQAAAFHRAVEAWVYRAVDSGGSARREAGQMLRRAEAIAAELDIVGLLGGSAVLPSGFTQRLRAFAAAVRFAVPAAGPALPELVARAQQLLGLVETHRAADPIRVETARMALRLLRWLASPEEAAPATLFDAVDRHVWQDGWVDRARLDIFAGDPDPEVAEGYRSLHRVVDVRRSRHDQQFAAMLAEVTVAGSAPGALLFVEDLLDRIVVPIVEHGRRVLLLVMDGMGVAAATELAESVTRSGVWVELTPNGGPRIGSVAVLPTVTETSRCSLLAGRVRSGGRPAELASFAQRFPDGRLLHKKALRAGAGAAFEPDVLAALADPELPVVAAVVNTIDDALDRSEPGTTVWGEDTIPAVRDLLAANQDRVVVVVSDHGHVVDRGPEAVIRPGDAGGNRWRTADRPPGDGEVLITGDRVVLAGGRAVLPWREELRYGPRKAGYHGGAAPAEVVVPALVFSAGDERAVPGWAGAPVASPEWWREPVPEEKPEGRRAGMLGGRANAAERRRRSGSRSVGQPESLFDLVAVTPMPSQAGPGRIEEETPVERSTSASAVLRSGRSTPGMGDVVDALLASERYVQRRGTRPPLSDERVAGLLRTLLANGDRATLETLAARARIPAHRISGAVAALRRLLQVEGYPVLTLHRDGRTVHLHRDLLIEQFDLLA
ncbi:BREX-2 system phosphatase PglZ [Micromonospora sp. WMMD1102]|uniref:BREX-2 system phosphatase PglZ n=1 Tax=Micromonospora sp. WMMD1102 TaxID=3016105 RepID=UPI0024158B13|nr:BREX-2 system phosphatase PglZ [Micromonospora sp. WMMD1102]MDG4789072.1 BREX-2 system phosphatase PglZ [Micromonospora sp. WMMD1102]